MRWRGTIKSKQALAVIAICYILLSITWVLRWSANTDAQGGFTSYQARSAESFIDSIGVNTHLGYPAYRDNYDSIIKPKLQALGVRHIREPLPHADSGMPVILSRYSQLAHPSGGAKPISISFISSKSALSSANPGNDCFLPNIKTIVQGGNIPNLSCNQHSARGAPVSAIPISGISNLNEPDHCPSYSCGGHSNTDPNSPFYWWTKSLENNPNWPSDTLNTAQLIHTKIRNDSATSSLPILAPSLVWLPYYGDVNYPNGSSTLWQHMQPLRQYVNRSDTHPYCQLRSIANCYQSLVQPFQNFFTGIPAQATETGHSTADYSEKVQAKYATSIFFDFFARGVERTYYYELFDDVSSVPSNPTINNYGLVNEDGREKIVYGWLKNTIALLTDQSWSPQLLEMNMNLPSSVRYLLLQKTDGSFWLALHNDRANRTDNDVNSSSFSINFRSAKNINYYNLESLTPYQTQTGVTSINLSVADRITLLQISDPSSSGGNGGNGGGNNGNGPTGGGPSSNASGSTGSNAGGKATTKKGSTSSGNGTSPERADEGGFSLGPIQLKNATTFDRALNATILVGSILGLIFMIVTLVVARMRIARRGDEFEDVDINN